MPNPNKAQGLREAALELIAMLEQNERDMGAACSIDVPAATLAEIASFLNIPTGQLLRIAEFFKFLASRGLSSQVEVKP